MTRTMKRRSLAASALAALAVAGVATAQSAPERVRIDGERTTLTPSAALSAALSARGVTLTPVGRVRTGEGGSLVFPIVRGRVNPPDLRGRIVHRGAVKLTLGERSLRLRRFVIRTTRRGSVLTATAGRACRRALRRCGRRIALARLTNVRRSDAGGLLIATADLVFTERAARRINRRLGAQVVGADTALGTAKIEVKPKS